MASVDWKKLKGANDVKSKIMHNDKEERVNRSHSNTEIDKGQTSKNVDLVRLSYKAKCHRYDMRISALDDVEGQNKRKDRVTAFGLSVPVPENLPEEKEVEWCKRAHSILSDFFGVKNLISADIHRDEKHEYTDPDTGKKRMSRTHLQSIYVSADADDHLRAKNIETRKNMKILNNKIHEMSEREFGVPFMDGTKQKSRGTVETLKNKSLIYEAKKYSEEMQKMLEAFEKRTMQIDKFLEKEKNEKIEKVNEQNKKAIQKARLLALRYDFDLPEDEEEENDVKFTI